MKQVSEEEARRIAEQLYRYDNIASERAATIGEAADGKAVDFYRRNGYLVVDRLIDEEEVAAALREVSDIAEGRITGPRIVYSRQSERSGALEPIDSIRKINDYADYAPALGAMTRKPELLALLEALLGERPRNILNQAQLKPPNIGEEKPWHQDMGRGR